MLLIVRLLSNYYGALLLEKQRFNETRPYHVMHTEITEYNDFRQKGLYFAGH